MNTHYIEKCRECGVVISQCRCADKDKDVRWGICEECQEELDSLIPINRDSEEVPKTL